MGWQVLVFTMHKKTLHNQLSFIFFNKETELNMVVQGNKWGRNSFHYIIFF